MNDLINQVEYQTGAQQRAQQILQTVQPSTSLSTSARTPPRPRSAPVRRTSAIANQATDRIMDNMERQLTRIENNIAAVRPSTAVQRGAATRIQSAIRNRNARHELDKSVTARVKRMENDLRGVENTMSYIRPSTAIQNAARKSLKKSQDTMSEQRTRRQPTTQAITNAQENINLMDQVIIKKSKSGRPRKEIQPKKNKIN